MSGCMSDTPIVISWNEDKGSLEMSVKMYFFGINNNNDVTELRFFFGRMR